MLNITEQLSYAKDTLWLNNALEKEIYRQLITFKGNGTNFVKKNIVNSMQTIFSLYISKMDLDVDISCIIGKTTAGSWDDDHTIILTLNPVDILCIGIGPAIDDAIEYDDIHDLTLKELLDELIKALVGNFLHELQHYLQSTKANKDKSSKIYSYRSYNNKDKQNFYDKINAGILDIDYKTSPEEIDAFAIQAISEIISDMKTYDSHEQRLYITNCFQTIAAIGKKYISDEFSDNKIAIKSRNRYMKKVYSGLKEYADHHLND
jgi:hypothetical protein